MWFKSLIQNLPEVSLPKTKLSLKTKLKWTLLILVLFYVLSLVPLYGITAKQASYFQSLELLLGAKFGKLLTLGIGPIVTASIVLQLLIGSGLLKFDMTTEKGKALYTGAYKLMAYLFILLEAFVYVKMGAITPATGTLGNFLIVFVQLALGGLIVLYMDEVVKSWGIGSGISLFIAAGVAQAVFIQMFSPLTSDGSLGYPFSSEVPVGKVFSALYYVSHQEVGNLLTVSLLPILTTVALFLIIVYFQSINVEIPLSFGRIRGHSIRWPLNFFYTSNIPVILIAALGANFRLWATLWEKFRGLNPGESWFSQYFISYITPVRIWDHIGSWSNFLAALPHVITYTLFMVVGSVVFGIFWVQTSSLDPRSQAINIVKSGLQIPGFRKDVRIIERLLAKYIGPLTIMGGVAVGLLAAFADTFGALSTGTGLLLLIMIVYQFYQILARESMEDITLLKKLFRR